MRSRPVLSKSVTLIGVAMWALTGANRPTLAQPDGATSPLERATEPAAAKPLTAAPGEPTLPEAEITRLQDMMVGSFASTSDAARPSSALTVCNSARVTVNGLSNAVYFEIAPAGGLAQPRQQGIIHFMRVGGELRARLLAFQGSIGAPLIGLWAEPRAFPPIEASALMIVADVPLSASGEGYEGRTMCRYPTGRGGAVEATSGLRIMPRGIRFEEEGFDAQGRAVWGGADASPELIRSKTSVEATWSDAGLAVIKLQPGAKDAPVVSEGGEVKVHYTGWLTSGMEFDSSRRPGREPFTLRLPGQVIAGWNEGLAGIAKGERRRIVIPGALAYGPRGRPPVIPPNATLIFDVECVDVNNEPPVAGSAPGAATPPARPAPAAGGADGAGSTEKQPGAGGGAGGGGAGSGTPPRR